MSFLLDDAAFGGQVMIGAGQPTALGLGVGEKPKIRGSAFIEGPAQIGKSSDFVETGEGPALKATLMVGRTANVDCGEEKPEKSVYVMGDVVIDGRQTEGATPGSAGSAESLARTLLVQGTVRIEGFSPEEPGGEPITILQVVGDQGITQGNLRVFKEKGYGGNVIAEEEVISKEIHILSAKKNFDIPHPSKEGWRLRHTCIEGPSNDVYIKGRVKNSTEISFPSYWKDFVDIQSIVITLQPIGAHQDIIIKRWDENKVYLQSKGGMSIDCFYHIIAERIDGEKLIVEYVGSSPTDYPGDNSEYSVSGYHYDTKEEV